MRMAKAWAWLRNKEIVADTVAFQEEWSEGIARDCYGASDPIAVPVVIIMAEEFDAFFAAHVKLERQMEAIEQMGREDLNVLPDCTMALAQSRVENLELRAQVEAADRVAGFLDRALDIMADNFTDGREAANEKPPMLQARAALAAYRATGSGEA